jgi:protein SCO1/2
MHNVKLIWSLVSLLAGGWSAAAEAGAGETPRPPRSADAVVYPVKGVFLETKGEGNVAVIDHEEIKGYMMAMVMPFRAADPKELAGLRAGDEIVFDYVVDGFESWIEGVKPTGQRREPKRKADGAAAAKRQPVLKVGDVLPDYEFLDETAKRVKLSDYRGQVVALTFVFTRCPVPEYCPRMMRNFQAAEAALRKDAAAPEKWRLLTISFDSFHDTPEKMKAYGQAYGQDPRNWSLLTSDSCCTIRELAENVDLRYTEAPGESFQHNLRTVVLDARGRITRIFTDETWEPADLVAAVREAGNAP